MDVWWVLILFHVNVLHIGKRPICVYFLLHRGIEKNNSRTFVKM